MANQVREKFLWLGVAISLVCSTATVYSSTVVEEDFLCPIDGTSFTSRVQASFYVSGMRLDLMPVGAVEAPWPLPVCPTDHFVILDYEPDELEKLQDFIPSEEYQLFVNEHSVSYALAAKILEFLGAAPSDVGYAYLQASWQVEDRPDRNLQYLTESLKFYRQALEGHPDISSDSINSELLAAELERRLGQFELAKARLLRIKAAPIASEGQLPVIIDYQLKLVAEQDSDPHELPSIE